MKRVFAIFLIAATSFTLCACGGKELTQKEREEIFYEVAQEKGLLEYVTGNGGTIIVDEGAYNSLTADLPANEQFIEILDVEFVHVKGDIYRPNLKIKNIFPEGSIQCYPDSLQIYLTYKDKEGFSIQTSTAYLNYLGYGEGAWTDSDSRFSFDSFDTTEVSSCSVTGYRFSSSSGGVVVYNEAFMFTPEINYDVLNLVPKNTDVVNFEEVKLISRDYGVEVEAKIRNKSDIHRDAIVVSFQVLDREGDILGDSTISATGLESGQAGTFKSIPVYDCKKEDVGAIKFVSYTYGELLSSGGVSYSNRDEHGDFFEPYLFSIDQLN